MTDYIAHRRDDDTAQPLSEHLLNAAKSAREMAEIYGGDFAYACGLSHDAGKYSDKFQKRIRGAGVKVDHATAGGQLLFNENGENNLARMACYPQAVKTNELDSGLVPQMNGITASTDTIFPVPRVDYLARAVFGPLYTDFPLYIYNSTQNFSFANSYLHSSL